MGGLGHVRVFAYGQEESERLRERALRLVIKAMAVLPGILRTHDCSRGR